MGFIPDIERICKLVPFTRQTLFFTATMPPEIRRITEAFLHNPVRIEVSKPATTAVTVTQSQVPCRPRSRTTSARCSAACSATPRTSRTRSSSAIASATSPLLDKSLQKHGFSVGALHGDMDQSARTAALDQFRKGEIAAARRLRRRRPRPRHSRGQPRLQFRRAAPSRRLRPSHRPHRPRRTHRHRDLHRHARSTEIDDAIEKLIGQPIPARRAATLHRHERGSSDEDGAPRRSRSREAKFARRRAAAAASRRTRARAALKANAKRVTARTRAASATRSPASGRDSQAGARTASRPAATAPQAPAPSQRAVDRPCRATRPQREADLSPADHSHLPAFLLRPVRAAPKAGSDASAPAAAPGSVSRRRHPRRFLAFEATARVSQRNASKPKLESRADPRCDRVRTTLVAAKSP